MVYHLYEIYLNDFFHNNKQISDKLQQLWRQWYDFDLEPVIFQLPDSVDKYLVLHPNSLIIRREPITEDFIKKYYREIKWSEVYFDISEETWVYLMEQLPNTRFRFQQNSDQEFSREFMLKYWRRFAHNEIMTSKAILTIIDDIWEECDNYQKFIVFGNIYLPENFIEDHYYDGSWLQLSSNRGLSEQFFERHLDKVDWYFLPCNKGLSLEFLEKHIDKIKWSEIAGNTILTEEFLLRHIDNHISEINWSALCSNTSLTEKFFETLIARGYQDKLHWWHLCSNPSVSLDFIAKHIHLISWFDLCYSERITYEFIQNHYHNTIDAARIKDKRIYYFSALLSKCQRAFYHRWHRAICQQLHRQYYYHDISAVFQALQ